MFELTDVIVIMWFFPVIFYSIIPLALFCGWGIIQWGMGRKSSKRITRKLDDQVAQSTVISKASA